MAIDQETARELCLSLLAAESENEVQSVLVKYGYWDDSSNWREFGDNENNFATIGNQQSNPVAALVEKLVNSVDAVLMMNCFREGINPESQDAPQSIAAALERYFDIKDGNLANISTSKRNELAQNIGFVATGQKQNPNYTIFDLGEGQTPNTMPLTLLSLRESNKLRIPFVQGKFNMGGTGVLQFCGHHNFELIISRRQPEIATSEDPSSDYWGFTIVRREDPSHGRRSSMFTYLAPEQLIPAFESDVITIPCANSGTQEIPDLGWGTIIKLFEYGITGYKTNILFDLYNYTSLLLARVGLPIRFYERRDYSGHTLETTLSGLHVRLEEDKRENLEDGFPSNTPFSVAGEEMKATIYAFKKGQAEKYRKSEGIIFTVNGQTHGVITQGFFAHKSVGMAYLADSLLVIVDCDQISGRAREDLFMNSRDRLRSGELRAAIENRLEEMLRTHALLRELRERRRREEIESKLADSRPLRDILNDILKKSPALSALFLRGKDLSNPFKSRKAAPQERFVGKSYPTYFILKQGDEDKDCHINLRFRVQFETDVVNDYFGRDQFPGKFSLQIDGTPVSDYVLNLSNGIATLTVTLPPGVQVGHDLSYQCSVVDDASPEPFNNTFCRHVIGPYKLQNGKPSERRERKPPDGSGDGDRETPDALAMPPVVEVREAEWGAHGFDKYSALKAMHDGKEGYDFFVNLDNVYLKTEIKGTRGEDPRLLEARFKYALVLIGLSILKEQPVSTPVAKKEGEEQDNDQSEQAQKPPIESQIYDITRAVAPTLLPMIESLGSLEIDEEPELSPIAE